MTSVETLMAILSRYPFAEELRPSDLEKLCAMACEIPFRKNEIIFREGDECNVFYLLTSGKVILEIAVGGNAGEAIANATDSEFTERRLAGRKSGEPSGYR